MSDTIVAVNKRILDFLGISGPVIEIDISLRIRKLPTVRILRHIEPLQILGEGDDRHLATEEVQFTLVPINPPETAP